MGKLRASASRVDLEPPAGTWMTGFAGRFQPAAGTHDPIMARAVLLDDGDTQLAIVSCDLLGFTPAAVAEMRFLIAERSSIPGSNVLICCTHTHSGPTSMPMRGAMGHINEEWLAHAQSSIVDLVSSLAETLEPASLGYASTMVSGIGYNRQDQSHPIDEELSVIAIDSEDGQPIATMLNYSTHAVVLGPGNLEFSGDFPGATVQHVERLRGGVGLYLQGACGDVDPVVYRDRGWGAGTFEDVEAIGERLAEESVEVLESAPRTGDVTLRVASKVVDVPLDSPPSKEDLDKLAAAFEDQRRMTDSPVHKQVAEAMLQWADELREAMEADAVPKSVPAEVFAAAINDLRLVGLPFETYTDIGLGIKEGLKPLKALFVGYANGLYGYLPARWAKDQGGYGPNDSCRWFGGLVTPVGYGADELLIREGVGLAR